MINKTEVSVVKGGAEKTLGSHFPMGTPKLQLFTQQLSKNHLRTSRKNFPQLKI